MKRGMGITVVLAAVVMGVLSTPVAAQETITKEILLQVRDNIITLPPNEATRVPVSAARIRSTELRNINEQYNVVSLEKLFKLKSGGQAEFKGMTGTDSREKIVAEEPVGVTTVFTKEKRDELESRGDTVQEMANVFLVQMEFEEAPAVATIVNAYRELTEVISAEEVIRKE